jgi:hypothetical protein
MSLVSDQERERAAMGLRRQYLSGRLSIEELAERVDIALRAREQGELRSAFVGLPPFWRDGDEVRRVARQAKRAAVLALLTVVWTLGSFGLLCGFTYGVLVHGLTLTGVLVYPALWLVMSALVWRAARRA